MPKPVHDLELGNSSRVDDAREAVRPGSLHFGELSPEIDYVAITTSGKLDTFADCEERFFSPLAACSRQDASGGTMSIIGLVIGAPLAVVGAKTPATLHDCRSPALALDV